jgi:outer membrane protein TolC
MSQQAYQQGQINFLEISSARAAYIGSYVNYLEALERLADSIVKIEGALLENSLE